MAKLAADRLNLSTLTPAEALKVLKDQLEVKRDRKVRSAAKSERLALESALDASKDGAWQEARREDEANAAEVVRYEQAVLAQEEIAKKAEDHARHLASELARENVRGLLKRLTTPWGKLAEIIETHIPALIAEIRKQSSEVSTAFPGGAPDHALLHDHEISAFLVAALSVNKLDGSHLHNFGVIAGEEGMKLLDKVTSKFTYADQLMSGTFKPTESVSPDYTIREKLAEFQRQGDRAPLSDAELGIGGPVHPGNLPSNTPINLGDKHFPADVERVPLNDDGTPLESGGAISDPYVLLYDKRKAAGATFEPSDYPNTGAKP